MQLALLIAMVSVTMSQGHSEGIDSSVGLSSCVNQNETTNTSLVIDCTGRKVDSRNLTKDLNSMLSGDEIRDHVTSLKISNTPLTQVPTSVCQLTNLIVLQLDRNRLTELPDHCFTNMPDLRILWAHSNNITSLQDGIFDGLRHLGHIVLNRNRISKIGGGVFSQRSDLVSLTLVSLKYNNLTTLEPWPAILGAKRSTHRPIAVLVGNNRIAHLTNTIGWHYNCSMLPTYFYVDFSRNQLTHLTDMLSGWGLSQMDYLCLMKTRGHYPVSRFYLAHNPIICDCRDFYYYALTAQVVSANLFQKVHCSEPIDLYPMQVVSVQLIQFICDLEDGCPPGCKCSYRPANATVHVRCPSNFTSFPFRVPPLPKSYAKYKLEMSNSKLLRRLEHRPYLVNTSYLDVSHSRVEEIGFETWRALVHIPVVLLNDNAMTKIPREYSEVNITSRSIALQRNPWDCSCERRWMHDWLNSDSDHFANPSSILCQSPPRLRGTSIMKMYRENFCVDRVKRMVTVSVVAVTGSVGLLIGLGVAIYCLRVRLHRSWNFHPFDRDECRGEDMEYDVFLSCSLEDRDTHGRRLLDVIESKGYRVFRPGAYATDDTREAVQRSRRTVCLLSKHFIKSQYCLHEFKWAFEHNAKRDKRLVILKMLDNPLQLYTNDCPEAAAVRQYLRNHHRRCIDFNDKDYLDKLLYLLPVHPLPAANSADSADTGDDVSLLNT